MRGVGKEGWLLNEQGDERGIGRWECDVGVLIAWGKNAVGAAIALGCPTNPKP